MRSDIVSDGFNVVISAEDKATQVLDGIAAKVSGLGGKLDVAAKFGSIATGIRAAGEMIAAAFDEVKRAVSEAANRIDELGDTAAKLGSRADDLRAFAFAAEEAGGISADEAINALKKLQVEVAKAAVSGENGGVWDKLGLDPQELAKMDPTAAFKEVQAAMGSIGSAAERSAIATKLFGKSASELLPLLLSDAEAFREAMQAANELGLTVSEQQTQSVGAMNDALGRLKAAGEGVMNQIVAELAPFIQVIAEALLEWVPPIIELAKQWLPTIVDAMAFLAGMAQQTFEIFAAMTTLNFGWLAEALNANRPREWRKAVEEAREAAAQAAIDAEEKAREAREAAIQQEKELAEETSKRADAAAAAAQKQLDSGEKVIEQLERQLWIAQVGQETVTKAEQLSQAQTVEQWNRIQELQAAIEAQLAQAKAAKEAEDQDKAAAAHNAKVDAQLLKIEDLRRSRNAPELQAAESRLGTRGNVDRTFAQMLEYMSRAAREGEKQTQLQRRIAENTEESESSDTQLVEITRS
jgi:hypothetical protein